MLTILLYMRRMKDALNVYKKIRYTCKTNLRNHFINKEKFGKYGVRIFRMHYDCI